MWEENFGTWAGFHLIEGVRLIQVSLYMFASYGDILTATGSFLKLYAMLLVKGHIQT